MPQQLGAWRFSHYTMFEAMGKSEDNLCKQALIAGQETCNGEDLLTECINICKDLKIQCITKGEPNKAEQLKIKKALWKENDKEIHEEMDKSEKTREIKIQNKLG